MDTYLPLIVPHFGGGAFFIFLFRQFFRSISEEIFEAARLDGCSYFGIYWRILIPLSLPVVATSAILIFQNSWQELVGPLIYLNSNDKYTIPLALATFRSSYGSSPWNLIMAVSIVAALYCYSFLDSDICCQGLWCRSGDMVSHILHTFW